LQSELGQFPLFEFWGPGASIRSSRWIAEAAKRVEARYGPTLTLVYLPHLDYALQKLGPHHPGVLPELGAIDAVVGDLIDFYEARGARVVVLSEYGISEVTQAIPINQMLRVHGLLAVRDELGHELLDPGESAAFAVADHQVAHVYVNDPARLGQVRRLIEGLPGVEAVLDEAGKGAHGLRHERSGELVAIAKRDAWFSYYYWLDNSRAPDFARTVDIHRKPGYDPVELFLDPGLRFPRMHVGWTLLKKQLGFRTLMDVVPLNPRLVHGSHGRPSEAGDDGPLLITQQDQLLPGPTLRAEEVFDVLLRHLDLAAHRRAA
jgi:predicted AlkP superfamily pyrophosphatase or phosphodiesterase